MLYSTACHPSFTFRKHPVPTPEILVLRRLRQDHCKFEANLNSNEKPYHRKKTAVPLKCEVHIWWVLQALPFQRFYGARVGSRERRALHLQLSMAICTWLCSCQPWEAWGSSSSLERSMNSMVYFLTQTTHTILSSKGTGMNVEVTGKLHKAQGG